MTRSSDFAIVGGGLAGSALAIYLAHAGRQVVVLEKDHLPRDKLCGEFLSPESKALLEELGCLGEVLARGAVSIRRARFTSPAGVDLEMELPDSGLGVSRAVLDDIVFRRAAACGASIYEGSEVTSITAVGEERSKVQTLTEAIGTRCPIAAYGRFTRLDRAHGRAFVNRAHPHVGFKKHHRVTADAAGQRLLDAIGDTVEIHTFEGGYCGISPIEANHINVCMLVSKQFVSRLPTSRWDSIHATLCDQSPSLRERFAALEPIDNQLLAVGHVPFSAKEITRGSILYVGDAAGMIAPLCGDGQAMALSSARVLGDLLCALPQEFDSRELGSVARAWRRRWRQHYGARMVWGRFLQSTLLNPATARLALACLRRAPRLTQRLVRWTRETL